MKKKILLFDIDRTLFDTDKWYVDHENVLQKVFSDLPSGNDPDLLCKSYFSRLRDSSKNYNVNIIDHIKSFAKEWNFDVEQLTLVIGREYEQCNYSLYVSASIVKMLEHLRENFSLGIFSEGDDWFQMLKLQGAGIQKFFNKKLIYIYKNKLENIDELPGDSYVFDDSERIIKGIRSLREDIVPI